MFVRSLMFAGVLACCCGANAQTGSLPVQVISLEAGKTGAVFGVTFDQKGKDNLGFRFMANTNLGKSVNLWSLGFGAYKLTGRQHRFFELGIDISYLHVDVVSNDQFRFGNLVAPVQKNRSLYATLNAGYRRYGQKSLFRAGLAPGLYKHGFLPGGYISWGLRL